MKQLALLVALAAVLSPSLYAQPQPEDLIYLGAFAPAQYPAPGPRFGFGMRGLAYVADCAGRNDPSPEDGYPGCLLATSNVQDDMMAMFDIIPPAKPPENARARYSSLKQAREVLPFFKCSIRADGSDAQNGRDIPAIVVTSSGEAICMCGHDWYNVSDTDYDSHCWFDLDPAAPNAKGPYGWGPPGKKEFHSQRMAAYLATLPQPWADAHLKARGEPYCLSGMVREGGGCAECSGGPTIYSFPCQRPASDPPGPLKTARELLGYDNVHPIRVPGPQHPAFSPTSQALGVVWTKTVILVAAAKGGAYWWYGEADPWNDEYANRNGCSFNKGAPSPCFLEYGPPLPEGTKDNCSMYKGYHALLDPDGSGGVQQEATIQFYSPDRLAEVAARKRKPSSVLPYAEMKISTDLVWGSRCPSIGGIAHDGKRIYLVETNGEAPVLHVWSLDASN